MLVFLCNFKISVQANKYGKHGRLHAGPWNARYERLGVYCIVNALRYLHMKQTMLYLSLLNKSKELW
jgi:hypothetical protein